MPLQPLSADDVRDALSYISPNLPRDDWARIGMALKSEFSNDLGLDLFDQWSSTGEGYDRNAVVSTWRSIRADGPVKIGTLLKQAQENGFKPHQDSAWRAPSPSMDAATQAAQAAAAAIEQKVRLTQQQDAAAVAEQMWLGAQTAGEAAYLHRKGVDAHGTRTTVNGTLLVPLVDDQGKLWNVQRILPKKLDNGTDKLFLKGGRKSGLFHVIGDLGNNPQQPILLAEGYATAASLHEATGWPAVVCFDAGNLVKVSKQFRRQYPAALMVVAGDDDLPTMAKKGINPGRDKATLVAEQTSAVVAFPLGLAPEHSDFNDLVAQLGQVAGYAQIRSSLHEGLHRFIQNSEPSPDLPDNSQQQAMLKWTQQVRDALETLERQGLPDPDAQSVNASKDAEIPVASTPGASEQLSSGLIEAQQPVTTVAPSESTPASSEPATAAIIPLTASASASAHPQSETSPVAQAIEPATASPAPAPAADPAPVGQAAVPATAAAAPVVASDPVESPAARPDPNNDLNLQALQAKRARDAQLVRQDMGKSSVPQAQAGTSGVEPTPSLGMNSAIGTEPVQEPGPDTFLYQELRALRERLAKEFQFDGAGKYYFRQGKLDLAFEDKGAKFDTPHHTPEVVASIAQLAHAKGWKQMHLSGTPEFRREMWLQASLLNIKVIGYEPEAIDHVRLTERRQLLAKDKAPNATPVTNINSVSSTMVPNPEAGQTSGNPISNSPAQSAQAIKSTPAPALLSGAAAKQLDAQLRDVLTQKGANESRAVEMTLGKLYAQVQSPRVYLGQLLEHGSAPYKFDPKEQDSYFVKLQTKTGIQTVWGVDLPRALTEMSPNGDSAIGQDILLAFQGVKKVQALVPQKDASGLAAGEQWELVDRNTWFAQPVMQAYAQSQQELAQMPPVSSPSPPANPSAISTKSTRASEQTASDAAPQATRSVRPAQAMQAAIPAADRLRHALAQLRVDPLEAEITLASMQSLLDSPKFQVGQLLEHGQAPLQFTKGQPLSYYMKLSTEQGHVLLWSADFPRAMNINPVQLGQTVVAAYRGIEVVSEAQKPAQPRNDWLVAPLEQLHEEAQQGVIQRMTNAQVMPASAAPGPSATQEQQSLYILREAMRQAGIPQEFAQATLKDAQRLLGTAPANMPSSLGQPGHQTVQSMANSLAPKSPQPSPAPSVSRKVGPSI